MGNYDVIKGEYFYKLKKHALEAKKSAERKGYKVKLDRWHGIWRVRVD